MPLFSSTFSLLRSNSSLQIPSVCENEFTSSAKQPFCKLWCIVQDSVLQFFWYTYDLQVKEELLSLGRQERYWRTIQTTSGKLISDIVLQTLTRQERKQGVAGSQYIAEKENYEEAMNSAFNNLLVRKPDCVHEVISTFIWYLLMEATCEDLAMCRDLNGVLTIKS